MAEPKQLAGVVGLFDDPEPLVEAARRVRAAGYRRWDCHTPYPVHGLDEAMGLAPSMIGSVAVSAGLVGVGAALLMQWWMSVRGYPVLVGGKPLASWLAFVPITFELFVLFTALTLLGGLIVLCRLWRWHSPLHDTGVMAEVTSRRFALVLSADDAQFSQQSARALLHEAGCQDVRELWDTGGAGRLL